MNITLRIIACLSLLLNTSLSWADMLPPNLPAEGLSVPSECPHPVGAPTECDKKQMREQAQGEPLFIEPAPQSYVPPNLSQAFPLLPSPTILPPTKPLQPKAQIPKAQQPKKAHESLTGLWMGEYSYGDGRNPVKFSALLQFIPTASMFDPTGYVQGTITEPNTFGDASAHFLEATLSGRYQKHGLDQAISWVKIYNGTGGAQHSVRYEGVLKSDKRAFYTIEGQWFIGSASGNFFIRQNKADDVLPPEEYPDTPTAERAEILRQQLETANFLLGIKRITGNANATITQPYFNHPASEQYIHAYSAWMYEMTQSMQRAMQTRDWSQTNSPEVQKATANWTKTAQEVSQKAPSEDIVRASDFIQQVANIYTPYAQQYASFVSANISASQPSVQPYPGQDLLQANPQQDWRGEWDVVTTSKESGRRFNSLWLLGQEGNGIFGASEWDCCPTYRVDKLTGTFKHNTIEVVRHVNGQDRDDVGSLIQIYTGTRQGNTITGTWTGPTQPAGGQFTATRRTVAAHQAMEGKPKPRPNPWDHIRIPAPKPPKQKAKKKQANRQQPEIIDCSAGKRSSHAACLGSNTEYCPSCIRPMPCPDDSARLCTGLAAPSLHSLDPIDVSEPEPVCTSDGITCLEAPTPETTSDMPVAQKQAETTSPSTGTFACGKHQCQIATEYCGRTEASDESEAQHTRCEPLSQFNADECKPENLIECSGSKEAGIFVDFHRP